MTYRAYSAALVRLRTLTMHRLSMHVDSVVVVEPQAPEAPETPAAIVVPVVTPQAQPETETLVRLAQQITTMESSLSTLTSQMHEIEGRTIQRVEEMLAAREPEVDDVIAVVPEPIKTPEVAPPKKERHPMLTLFLGKLPTNR